jgi:hypothetical protein
MAEALLKAASQDDVGQVNLYPHSLLCDFFMFVMNITGQTQLHANC